MSMLMILSMGTAVFADQEGPESPWGTITVNNAAKGETYKAYQILYLESYDSNANAYVYKANSRWTDWLKGKTDYVKVDSDGIVTWVDGADVAAFAKEAKAFAKTLPYSEASREATGDSVVFEELRLGYYLIDSSLGSICALNTTNPDATIEEKNELSSIEKVVWENTTWGDKNDVQIGEDVEFKITIHLKKGAKNVVLHDKMDGGLIFKEITSVEASSTSLREGDDYTFESTTSDNCSFHLSFTDSYLESLTEDTDIEFYYKATLQSLDAVIGENGNINDAKLTFGNGQETEWDRTTTYTWELPIFKYTGNRKPLASAEFIAYKGGEGNEQYAMVTDGKLTGWTANRNEASTVISGTDGKVSIKGLDSGTYYLEEVNAPKGYNKLTTPIEVVIGHTTSDNWAQEITANGELTTEVGVLNKTGALLPQTGGIGTTVFYMLGAILAAGASLALTRRNKTKENEEK